MKKWLRTGVVILAAGMLSMQVPQWQITSMAASAVVSFSDPDAETGETFTVNVKVASPDGNLGATDLMLSYDPNILEFVSGGNASGGAGSVHLKGSVDSGSTKSVMYTLKFKAVAPGNTQITVKDYEVYDSSSNAVEVTKVGNSSIRVTGEAVQTADAALASLSISPGSLTPEFAADITSYTVNVDESVERIEVNASPKDSRASVSVSGADNLQAGANSVSCTVTASDGSTKREYLIMVNKGSSEAPAEAAEETAAAAKPAGTALTGETVSIDGQTYKLAKSFDVKNLPEGFTETTVDFNGEGIMAGSSQNGITLLYFLDAEEKGHFFTYDRESSMIEPYVTIVVEKHEFAVLEPDASVDLPDGFQETSIQLNDHLTTGWVPISEEEQEYCLLYGMNSAGERGIYKYDLTEKTMQRYLPDPHGKYDDAYIDRVIDSYNELQEKYNRRFIYIIALGFLSVILLLAVINLLIRRHDEYEDDDDYDDFDEEEYAIERRIEERKRSEEERARAEREQRAAEKARAEREQRAAAEKARAERERAEREALAAEKARAEREQRAAAERARAEREQREAEERARAERGRRAAGERTRADQGQRSAESRLAAERRLAEERRISGETRRQEAPYDGPEIPITQTATERARRRSVMESAGQASGVTPGNNGDDMDIFDL